MASSIARLLPLLFGLGPDIAEMDRTVLYAVQGGSVDSADVMATVIPSDCFTVNELKPVDKNAARFTWLPAMAMAMA